MLDQNPKKVKRIIRRVVEKASSGLSIPDCKFLLEIVSASVSAGSLNLMELSRSLKEAIGIKHTHKRLQRHVSQSGHFLDLSNQYSLSHPAEPISEETFNYLDGGELTYSKAKGYEYMSSVRDGSSPAKTIKPGYPLNMICCRNGKGKVFPVYMDIFHRHVGYTSDNTESFKAIDDFMSYHGSRSTPHL